MSGVVCDLGVAARAIYNGKILLVKEARGNYQNLWGLPKGSVDEGESPESAVLRELSEETGVNGTIIGLSAVRSTLYKRKPAVFLCYDVSIESNQTSISTDEIDEIKWVDLEELKNLDWVSQTMHNLALDGLSGKRMSLKSSRPITKSDAYNVYSVNSQSKNVG
ncbi:MAG: hypothetical protein CMB76_01460 [Euryarchaeota archaeon]|nr:hypothetical protein [Euryarchaeota archaeon]|tara:strand:- start:1974 stop:2465 length:492 start_codon:yes stop_codon:yes gene_type:complete